MNDNCPVCPYCDTELNYDNITYDSFDTSTYDVYWRGTCPDCGRHFTWKEVYHYSHWDFLEEENDNG